MAGAGLVVSTSVCMRACVCVLLTHLFVCACVCGSSVDCTGQKGGPAFPD